jgi:chorismate dehydratase
VAKVINVTDAYIFAPTMTKKIRVGAVSYLNTKPLIYGFQQGEMQDQIELILQYPSRLVQALQKEEIDIALLPVAALDEFPDAQIFSSYCIASDDRVASVCLFSEVPVEEIQEVYLDYQSKTSVNLVRLLMKDYWKVRPMFIEAEEEYISHIKDKKAGVIIGDRALEQLGRFPFVYDLAEAWKDHTQLPFVFATWVTTKELSPAFIEQFNNANALGLQALPEIIAGVAASTYDLNTYYTKNIQYQLSEERRNGMMMFRRLMQGM